MSNITNTCLYQACTKITNIPSSTTMYHACTMHQPVPQPVPSTMYHNKCINHAPNLHHQHLYHTMSTMPSTMHINHVHQPSTLYHTMCQPCTSTMHKTSTNMPISPRCASSTMPTSSVQHAPQSCAKPRTKLCLNKYYTNINKTCIQSCTSNHVPQPYTISLMICLNHAIHHNIINM
jgi:hypothetical protein